LRAAVIDSADQAGFEQFALVGHSLGGVTITETAWRHPERVAQLVYVGALAPAPGASASIAWWGVDMPAGKPVTVDGHCLAMT
jgi:pimeloyl-ACP methyl ester carboxylesterase